MATIDTLIALSPLDGRYQRKVAALGDAFSEFALTRERVRVELADPVSDRIVELLIAAQEHGADTVVALLGAMAESVTKDLALDESIVTGQTEIRAQAVAAVALPFLVLAFLIVSNPGYRSFYRSGGGAIVIMLGAAMAAGGWKLITVLGRVPREPRVLDGSVRS